MNEQAPQPISTNEVRDESAYHRREHDSKVETRDLNQEYEEDLGRKQRFLEETIQTIKNAEKGQDSAGLAAVREEYVDVRKNREKASENVDAFDTARKAELWDAHEHLQQNREVYEQAAIEDANAAGEDIQFGGQNYPAQPVEQPKQPTA